jgi:GT2 family glycosyltransferase
VTGFLPWKVVHRPLDGPDAGVSREEGYGGVYLVLWLADVPVGHLAIPADRLPAGPHEFRQLALEAATPAIGEHIFERGFRSAPRDVWYPPDGDNVLRLEELTRCERPLDRFREKWREQDRMARSSRPTVSVIVCTRDRPRDLERCLASLQRSSVAPDEIIVVDNAPSTEETRETCSRFPAVRYVREPRPGLSVARNTGIRAAQGQILAFTDDDVEVHTEWVARLPNAFVDPATMATTGLVLPAELRTESQWLFETEFGGFSQGYRRLLFDREFFERTRSRGVPVWRIGAGASMAFRREAFQAVGLFNELLGAGAAGCSEDSELWYRLLVDGWNCRYDPAVVVFHTHRADLDGLYRQMHHYMRGHVATLLLQAEQHRHPGNLYRFAVALPWHYTKKGLYGAVFGYRGRRLMIPAEMRGCLSGVSFYLRNRRAAAAAAPSLETK